MVRTLHGPTNAGGVVALSGKLRECDLQAYAHYAPRPKIVRYRRACPGGTVFGRGQTPLRRDRRQRFDAGVSPRASPASPWAGGTAGPSARQCACGVHYELCCANSFAGKLFWRFVSESRFRYRALHPGWVVSERNEIRFIEPPGGVFRVDSKTPQGVSVGITLRVMLPASLTRSVRATLPRAESSDPGASFAPC